MKVALVFPPYKHKIFSENLSVVDEEFCLAPPIMLAYVAAILEKHGHKVLLLDARALNLRKEEALSRLRLFEPDLIGFRAETYHFHDALDWVGYFKQQLNVPVVTGGVNLSLYPRETLDHPEIDYGIIGEAIESLPEFLARLENNDTYSDIKGLVYKDKRGKVIINPASEKYIDFDVYPFPARHLLPNDRYYSFISQLKNFTIMLTSTGCPFRCAFCAIHPNTVYRTRSPKSVVDEIELCYREFGVREIDFFDATFFIDKQRSSEIFRQMKQRGLKIEWSCRSRVDVVDKDILKEASMAGCRQIYYGIESVEHDVLERIKKDIKLEQVKQAIKWTKDNGIRSMGFFMVGNPGETKDSVRRTIEFAKSLDIDFIQVCRTIAKPGTELDKIMIEKTGRDYWRMHIAGDKIKGRLPTPWVSLSQKEIEVLTKEFYLKFYFRPQILLRRLLQLKSLAELLRYFRVGLGMFLQKSELYAHLLTDTTEAEEALEKSRDYLEEAGKKRVAIVIPTYNERENIAAIIDSIIMVLPCADIVVVDDSSPDGTAAIVSDIKKDNSRVHLVNRSGKRGLGLAYPEGFSYVLRNLDSDYVFEMDADFSHNPGYLPLFLYYAQDFDLVTGSRFLKRVTIKNRSLWRNIISKSTKWFANFIIGTRITDVTTGFKCFNRELLRKIDFTKVSSQGYAFQIEVTYNAYRKGARIKEVPILFVERSLGQSKMSAGILLEGIFLTLKLSLRRVLNIFRGKR